MINYLGTEIITTGNEFVGGFTLPSLILKPEMIDAPNSWTWAGWLICSSYFEPLNEWVQVYSERLVLNRFQHVKLGGIYLNNSNLRFYKHPWIADLTLNIWETDELG